MQRILLLTLIGFLLVNCQSICDRNIQSNQESTVATVVGAVITEIATGTNGAPLKYFFDGTHPVQTKNFFTDPVAAATLTDKLTQFFFEGLNCTTEPINATRYNFDFDLAGTHANLNISYHEHAIFNKIVVDSTQFSAEEDKAEVYRLLDSFRGTICKNEDCNTICHKYITPGINTTNELVSFVVSSVVAKALASPLLIYFDGTQGNRVNYTDPANEAAKNTLVNHLVQFFGSALGCDDGTIDPYVDNLRSAHVGMGITLEHFNAFNDAVISVLTAANLEQVDLDAVKAKLESTREIVCTDDTDCNPNRGSSGGQQSSGGEQSSGAQSSGATSAAQTSDAQSSGQTSAAESSGAQSSGQTSGAGTSTGDAPNPPAETSSDAATLFFSVVALVALLF